MNTVLLGTLTLFYGLQPLASGVTTTSGADFEMPAFHPAYEMWVTAYSSAPEETDSTPFTTALGTAVRDGVVATNMFPFGTRIRMPELFGEKIFIVEDRMHRRKIDFVDVWMSSKKNALMFGISRTKVVILN